MHERRTAALEADTAAGPVARNGVEPTAETGRTRHSRDVRNFGIRHSENDASELWMSRADAVRITVEHGNRPQVRQDCRRVHDFEVRNSLNDRPATVPAVDSRVVEQVIHHGDPMLGRDHWNPDRGV